MEIRSIQGPQGLDALGATAAPAPQPPEQDPSNSLAPAVKVDLSDTAYESRFTRDVDTRALVFQVVDSTSGDVVDQLPSENVLRNRAYASSTAKANETKVGDALRVA